MPDRNDLPRDCLAGGGEMGALMRSMDWSKTALGPVESWPQSLRTSVSTCLNSRFPILLWWGPAFIKLYNDAYRPMLGDKHPRSMGQRGRDCWPEIWHIIGPMLEAVKARGEATWSENQLLPLERHGFPEECYFTFSYSPIRDETGGIGGVFSAVTETTRQVLGERRLRTLRDAAAHAAMGKTEAECWRGFATPLESNPNDLPSVSLYREAGDGAMLERMCVAGSLTLAPSDATAVDRAALEDWRDGAPNRLLLPIGRPGVADYGVMAVATSERRPLDADYRDFLQLLADNVASGIANARAHEDERRRATMLAELDRAKTAFFGNVSHEFRTPLTLMLGPVEDALADAKEPLSAPQRERLELVRRNGLRLQRLVNALLDFSRFEAGRARATFTPTDLGALTADIASSFRSAIEKGGVRLSVDCATLAHEAYVDREMWEKVVLNLLSNAFKFTFEGEIRVALRETDGSAELVVSDTGTGIPDEELPRVFERFHRVRGAQSRTNEGTGIGLALVQELVRLHGGSVLAQSREGEGSAFTVRIPLGSRHLPREHIVEAASAVKATSAFEAFVEEALRWLPEDEPALAPHVGGSIDVALARPADRARRRRILLADDNADMRAYVRRLLLPRYDVAAVGDGEAALALARAEPPDLVLSDVMMPKVDGLELTRRLRADPATSAIPVILLSARAGAESSIEGLDAGADAYLFKPFTARELLAHVSARLELADLHRALVEERAALATMFAQTPIPTAVLRGPELVFELANPAYVALVDGRDLRGRPLLDALPELRGQGFDELLRGVLLTGTAHVGREHRVRLARGSANVDAYFDYIYAPLRDAEGRVSRVLVVAVEVTERVQARTVLEDADRRKDEFLATLSHELRNPLAPMRNAVALLHEADHDPRTRALARAILDRQLRHVVRLVNDLLDVSRIKLGMIALDLRDVPLADVVESALEISRPNLEQAGHQVAVRLPSERLALHGDPDRLAQVVSNLLNNAAKFTPAGGSIEVSAWREGDAAIVAVKDNGCGIAPEMLERVFELFSRVDADVQRGSGAGLGIGLALARQIVALHGGTIEARSAGRGLGSEFRVRLPIVVADDALPGSIEAAGATSGAFRAVH